MIYKHLEQVLNHFYFLSIDTSEMAWWGLGGEEIGQSRAKNGKITLKKNGEIPLNKTWKSKNK